MALGIGAGAVVAAGVAAFLVWVLGSDETDEDAALAAYEALPRADASLPPDAFLFVTDDGGSIMRGTVAGAVDPVLTSERRVFLPNLAPDRRSFLYQSLDPSTALAELRVVATDGTGDKPLFADGQPCPSTSPPAWSPDGTQLAFSCFDEDAVRLPGLRVYDLSGQPVRTLDGESLVGHPTWTEDGDRILYWQRPDDGSEPRSSGTLTTIAADGSGPPQVVTGSTGFDSHPAWSADASLIAFHRVAKDDESDLYLLNLAPSDQASAVPVADGPGFQGDPIWSPGGSTLLFTDEGQLLQVTVAGDGRMSTPSPVDTDGLPAREPAWTRR